MLVKSDQHTNLLAENTERERQDVIMQESVRDLRQNKIIKGSETRRKNGCIWTAYLIQKLSQAGSCVVQLFSNCKVDKNSAAVPLGGFRAACALCPHFPLSLRLSSLEI